MAKENNLAGDGTITSVVLVQGLIGDDVKVDAIRDTLKNNEQKVGAGIVKRALSYPLKLITKSVGVNGSVVVRNVLS